MNEIKTKFDSQVSLSDLRQLGRSGGATARLDSGEIVTLKARYGTIARPGIVNGEVKEVELIVYYPDIFSQIRTIQRNKLLIARRGRRGKKEILLLTGKGYHRK